MDCKKMKFETSELMRLIYERSSLARFTSSMKLSEERLIKLLFGIEEFSYEEMLLAAKLLHLSNEEFLNCFFMPDGSEKLNFCNVGDILSSGEPENNMCFSERKGRLL